MNKNKERGVSVSQSVKAISGLTYSAREELWPISTDMRLVYVQRAKHLITARRLRSRSRLDMTLAGFLRGTASAIKDLLDQHALILEAQWLLNGQGTRESPPTPEAAAGWLSGIDHKSMLYG